MFSCWHCLKGGGSRGPAEYFDPIVGGQRFPNFFHCMLNPTAETLMLLQANVLDTSFRACRQGEVERESRGSCLPTVIVLSNVYT